MPENKEYPTGLFVSPPRPTAPDFVKGRISIRTQEFLEYRSEKDSEWVRVDVKERRSKDEDGNPKWYAQVDTWVKPSERVEEKEEEEDGDGLPF